MDHVRNRDWNSKMSAPSTSLSNSVTMNTLTQDCRGKIRRRWKGMATRPEKWSR